MAETTELKKSDFYFDLPQELIAQDPLEDRSSSRLLVLDKNTGEISHHIFRDIIDYLHGYTATRRCIFNRIGRILPCLRLLRCLFYYQFYGAFVLYADPGIMGRHGTNGK